MKSPLPLVLLASLSGACYSYTTASPSPANEGEFVRVALSDAGTRDLAPLVGPSAAQLEGRLKSADDSSLTLAVEQLVRRSAIEETWTGESVRVPRRDVTQVELRRFSRGRTTAMTAILVGGAAIVTAAASRGGSSTYSSHPAPPPTGQ